MFKKFQALKNQDCYLAGGCALRRKEPRDTGAISATVSWDTGRCAFYGYLTGRRRSAAAVCKLYLHPAIFRVVHHPQLVTCT